MFSISFQPGHPLESPRLGIGLIVLGQFSEYFDSQLDYWRREDYEAHWRKMIHRVVNERLDACLITSLSIPEHANFHTWWPMYVSGADVIFQNQLLFVDQLPGRFDPDHPYLSLSAFQSHNDEGERISEWRVPMGALETWLNAGSQDR
ncbi:hypothetical protein [Anatilimnocola floriformis]|uniref:hypothetical protein n=1 Tax=Anatilimnocola floriformis TaxID=2948575 RepID=UPI0020C32F5C|nr:hypothetical protein [Anatilimnocola floriformis]